MSSPCLDRHIPRTEAEAMFDIALRKLNDAAVAFRARPDSRVTARTFYDAEGELESAAHELRKENGNG